MEYLFSVKDGRVALRRFQVTLPGSEEDTAETWGFDTRERAERFAQQLGGTVEPVDASGLAWMEGLEVDSFEEAVAIYEMGQAAYGALVAAKAQKSPDQLRADVDYISVMTGVELV